MLGKYEDEVHHEYHFSTSGKAKEYLISLYTLCNSQRCQLDLFAYTGHGKQTTVCVLYDFLEWTSCVCESKILELIYSLLLPVCHRKVCSYFKIIQRGDAHIYILVRIRRIFGVPV